MSRFRTPLLVAATDLRRSLRNRSLIITTVLGPVILAAIISLAFGSEGFDATIGVADEDGSPLSTGIADGLAGAGGGGLDLEAVGSADEARARVDDGELDSAIVIPAGFAASLAGSQPQALDVLVAPDSPLAGEVARAVATNVAARVDAGRLAAALTVAVGGPPPAPEALAGVDLPIVLRQSGTGDVSPAAYFGPSMGLLFLFFAVGVVAQRMLEEHRTKVLDRVRTTPVTLRQVLAGKALSAVITGLLALLVIWGVTSVALGADWGDPVGVVALLVAASLAIAAIGCLVAAVARTERAADSLSTVLALVLALLGGSFIPLADMPAPLARIALATPNGLALRGFAELSAGGGTLADVLPHVGVLLVWAVVVGGLAGWLVPRRLGRT